MASSHLYNTITTILAALFEHEEKHLRNRSDAILERHIAKGGSKDGFRHMGMIVTKLTGSSLPRGTFDRLHESLMPEMDTLRTEKKQLETDKALIQQTLALVLKDAHTPQDIRDALPNCVQDIIPICRGLQRSRPEGYTLLDNPRALSQYMRTRDRIEFHIGTRLLY